MANTYPYRVRQGRQFGRNPRLVAGDIVHLTEVEAVGFLDLVEPVGGAVTAAPSLLPTQPTAELKVNPATPLPDGFPHKGKLEAAGFGTVEALRGASDKQLTDLPSIGRKSVQDIREALG